MFALLPLLFGVVKDQAQGWADRKAAAQKTTLAIEESKQKVAAGEQVATQEWEKLAVTGTQGSWKDEYVTIIVTAPAIAVFVPGLTPHVEAGFAVLATLPIWYQGIFRIGPANFVVC